MLSEAVRRAPGMAGPDDQVIIALDDPYIPRAQSDEKMWSEVLSALHLLHDRNTDCKPPILLCCGPTSQALRFNEDFFDNIFIKRLTVPHTLDDRNVLETWYKKRTGKKPPSVSQGDVLLVQLFFEWQLDESLPSFAHRFKKRLKEDSSRIILEAVYRIVCANRLYAGYQPNALNHLSPTQRDAFELLLKEHHFAIDEDPKRSGIWLTHPHIANGLFETWFPRDLKLHQRQAVLKDTILDGLRHGVTPRDQTTLLWALARLSDADAPFRERLARDKLEVLLQEVYTVYCSENKGTLDLKYLPAWIEMRFSYPNLVLTPDPLVEGLAQLLPDNKEETGFRLTCHKLIEHWNKLTKKEQLEVQGCIENLLVHTQGWKEWIPITVDVICRTSSPKVRKLFKKWLMDGENKESSLALSLFNLRQNIGQNNNWLLNINETWLKQHGDSFGAGVVLSSFLKRNDFGASRYSVATIAFDWSQDQERNPIVERVLRRLLGIPLSDEMSQKAFRLVLDYVKETELQASSSFLLAPILRSRIILKAGGLDEEAIKLGQMWLRFYSDDPGFCYIADRFLRLPKISDSDWVKIASISLDRLSDMIWLTDADYTLQSLLRRRHLLSKEYDIQLYDLICVWLKKVEQEINQLLNRPKPAFHIVAKKLASALPLVAQIGDFDWQTAFEAKAKKFRKGADKGARDKFDRELWRLFKAHSWPSYSIGRDVFDRLGLIQKESKIIAKLNRLLTGSTNAIDLSLQETLEEAYHVTETAIAEANFKGAGFLLGKMFPLSARLSAEALDKVILLALHYMDSSVPVSERCGLMLECDKHIEQNRWPNPEIAYPALLRSGLDTPNTLNFLARTKSTVIQENLPRTFDFLETLFEILPLRVGLFLPQLMVVVEISGEKASRERCRQLVIKFIESPKVSDVIKSNHFPKRLKKLMEIALPSIPDSLRAFVDTLGLQTPWLMEHVTHDGGMNAENLRHHLQIAKQLIQQNSPARAGFLLAPLLFLSANSRDDDILKEACMLIIQILEDPVFSHENRDGFINVLWRLDWPDIEIQDEIFQALGIGAPKLVRLLSEDVPMVTVEILERCLDHADNHLHSKRPRGAYQILLNALPLASWTGDEDILERSLALAGDFIAKMVNDMHILDLFSKGCLKRLQNGKWQNSETGLKCLSAIGIREKDNVSVVSG